ncbi:hypothetical protein N7466_004963 [Penicillium verhagenii]|uniref:uncharacterized protein n=1 Tax=Penicillium verhagenii TaxID=1562060 RepID=UPI00254590C9|nr:uncharacterized protein N7466_004963 [Penicillium verhagenii]KAJ5935416.1 hypothetical protein N7466_004963 [Penicillium verhagenii]
MRTSRWIGIWATFLPAVLSIETAPFSSPEDAQTNKRAFEVLQILKRSDNCPSGYNACTNEGNSDACCISGTTCTKDSADNIACCPTGASCTGSLTGTATSTSTGTTETGSSFVFPQGATATTTTESGTETVSTASGAYPFVYVPTSFVNAQSCSSYYSQCQSEYTGCTEALMGRYGVTVGGSGGGVTVEAVTATSQATSICSSLSLEACHGLSLAYCASVATATATATDASGNGALPGRSSSLHDLALGLVVGFAGMVI